MAFLPKTAGSETLLSGDLKERQDIRPLSSHPHSQNISYVIMMFYLMIGHGRTFQLHVARVLIS